MKMNIALLQSDAVRLLTCSQVITSVHSVVKELVENALDAEASSISIRLENYGLDVIEVKDNGSGVSSENVKFMATYGFRGEALHSVAAMASLSVTTRTEGEDVAHRYQFNSNGEVVLCRAAAQEKGTTALVTNLFKHFPVRRQCYRSAKRCKEELKKVEDYLLAFGICHPEVRFQLRHNKLTLWQKPVAPSFDANMQNILGPRCFQKMAPVNYQCFDPMVKIQALVPKPHEDLSGITRSTAERIFLFINKRPVEIKSLMQSVKQAFAEAFPSLSSRYPIAVLNISVLPQAMDVNLEPNKTSVLLHDLEFIATTLESLLQQVYGPCKVPAENAPITTATTAEQCPCRVPAEEARTITAISADEASRVPTEEEEAPISTAEQWPCRVPAEEGPITTDKQWPCRVPAEEAPDKQCPCRVPAEEAPITTDKQWPCRVPAEEAPITIDKQRENETIEDALDFEKQLLEESAESPFSLADEDPFDELTSDFFEDLDNEIARSVEEIARPDCLDNRAMTSEPPPFQTSLSQWSRGIAEGQFKQPVKLCRPEASSRSSPNTPQETKSKLIPKRPSPVFDMINSQPVKRKNSIPAPDTTKKQKQLSSTSERTSGSSETSQVRTADCQVEFNEAGVRRWWSADDPAMMESRNLPDRAIGWCELMKGSGKGVWLVVRDSTIACFNISEAKDESDSFSEEELTNSSMKSLLDKSLDKNHLFHCLHKLELS